MGTDGKATYGWGRGLWVAGVAAACAAMGWFGYRFLTTAGLTRHFSIMWFSLAVGVAHGLLAMKMGRLEKWTEKGWAPAEITCLLAFGIAAAGFSYWCGMQQFGGYDQSVLIDAGWRLYGGQIPYVDFPCTLPVGFYLGAEAAFRMFGVYWSSIIKLNVLYFLGTYFWMYLVLRQVFRARMLALLLVIACESMTVILSSFWWYNPITSVAAALYAASVAAVLLRPGQAGVWLSVCLSLLLTALMKPNMSGIVVCGGTVALLMDVRTRWKGLLASVIAFVLWVEVIHIHGSSIWQVLHGYLSVRSRGFSAKQFLQDIGPEEKYFAWAALVGVLAGLAQVARRRVAPARRPLVVLGGMTLLASLSGFYGNGEAKLVDLAPGLVALCLLMGEIDDGGDGLRLTGNWLAYVVLVCIAFTFVSLGEAGIRDRVRRIGIGTFFEYNTVPYPVQNGFFAGMTAGRNLHIAVNAITKLVAQGNTSRIFFGPRLQWAYAAFGIPSPKGFPIWWHPGVSFSQAEAPMYTKLWIDHRFNPLVTLDNTYMDADAVHWINMAYVTDHIYTLNKDSGPMMIMKLTDQSTEP